MSPTLNTRIYSLTALTMWRNLHLLACGWLVSVLLSTTMAQAATRTEIRKVTLADCVQSALEHNFDLKIQRYNPMLASNDLHVAFADYDPVLTFGGTHDYNRGPDGTDAAGQDYRNRTTKTDTFSGGITDLLPTGGTLSLKSSLSDSHGTDATFGTNGFFAGRSLFESTRGSVTFVELRQPLLRNFWIDNTRLTIRTRRVDLKISELAFRQFLMTVVFNVEQAYYELIAARENVAVQEKALEFAQRLYQENIQKVTIGIMAPLDEKQAQAQVAASQSTLISAQRSYSAQENVLKNLMTDDYGETYRITLSPTENLHTTEESLDIQSSWTTAFNNRPDLHQLILDLERRGLILKYQHNQLFPQLDLAGLYGRNAQSDEFNGAFGQLRDGSGPYYSVGASLSVPFTNRRARDNYRATKLERSQAEERLKQLRQSVMVQVDDAIKEAEASLRRAGATGEATAYAETALRAEEDKFKAGTSTSFVVLRLQRDLTTARSEEIRAQADYNEALSLLSLREGTILKRRNIDLEVK